MGSKADMLKFRKSKRAEMEAQIERALENYDGGLIAIITIDDNQKANVLVGGTDEMEASIVLSDALKHTQAAVIDSVIKGVEGNTGAIRQLIDITLKRAAEKKSNK